MQPVFGDGLAQSSDQRKYSLLDPEGTRVTREVKPLILQTEHRGLCHAKHSAGSAFAAPGLFCRAHKPEKVSLLNTLQEDSRWASFVASREFYLVEVLGLTQQEGPCWACLRGLLEAQRILCIMHPAALTQPRGHPVVPGGGPCGGGGAPLPFLCRAGPLLSPSPLLPPHPEPPSLSLISAVTLYWDSCFPLPTTSPAPSSYNSQWDLFQM